MTSSPIQKVTCPCLVGGKLHFYFLCPCLCSEDTFKLDSYVMRICEGHGGNVDFYIGCHSWRFEGKDAHLS